jgi:hypothetical protein
MDAIYMSSKASSLKKRFTNLEASVSSINEELVKAYDQAEKIIFNLETELLELKSVGGYPGLNFVTLRDALCKNLPSSHFKWIPDVLATSGSGPWNEQEFDDFLLELGIQPVSMPGTDINGLILGVGGWDEDELSQQIYDRDADSLRIYTQELFVVGIIYGADPYDFLEQSAIDEVGYEHPAIQYILKQRFVWPWLNSIAVSSDEGEEWDIDESEWANESVLKMLGYSVAANGPSESVRRRILKVAFESPSLEGIETSEQRKRWGASRSAKRLHAISSFLSWLINLQGGEKPQAKSKWLSDLTWLKRTYYDKTMRFAWPAMDERSYREPSEQVHWPSSHSRGEDYDSSRWSDPRVSMLTSIVEKRPNAALARIIGNDYVTVAGAVAKLANYIQKENLRDAKSQTIKSDRHLFALSGRSVLRDFELSELVRKHLS